jgi:hypothetical protein
MYDKPLCCEALCDKGATLASTWMARVKIANSTNIYILLNRKIEATDLLSSATHL